ncbi:hypothetical protein Scep_012592 [Stephania cephalantha]|uniref:Uncharacterized protein n=1 Tax=Stephania cephalantha TaxID=152367 RepID=A0AAP0JFD8_9MAGN
MKLLERPQNEDDDEKIAELPGGVAMSDRGVGEISTEDYQVVGRPSYIDY